MLSIARKIRNDVRRQELSIRSRLGRYQCINRRVDIQARSCDDKIETKSYPLQHFSPVIPFRPSYLGVCQIFGGNPGFAECKDLYYFPTHAKQSHAALYDASGSATPESLLLRGGAKAPVSTVQLSQAEMNADFAIEERPSIYLGYIDSHYGHLMTDTMSRLWIFREFDPRAYNLVYNGPFSEGIPGWIQELFEITGIPQQNISVYRRPTILKNVIVPRQGVILGASVWSAYLEYMAKVGERFTTVSQSPQSNQPIYLSRENATGGKRTIENEAAVVAYLRSRGCLIVNPERLSFREKINLFNRHDTVIGPWGAAHHSNLFAIRPLRNIYFGYTPIVPYFLIDAAKGNQSIWIHTCQKKRKPGQYSSEVGEVVFPKQTIECLQQLGI